MCHADTLLIVGRIELASESLFYYDVNNGFNFEYYRNTTLYNPVFDFVPTAEQQAEANELCLNEEDGTVNSACVYDYYATGNNFSAGVSGSLSDDYSSVQQSLGLFSVPTSLAYCIFAHIAHKLYIFMHEKWTSASYSRVWVYKNFYIFFIHRVS